MKFHFLRSFNNIESPADALDSLPACTPDVGEYKNRVSIDKGLAEPPHTSIDNLHEQKWVARKTPVVILEVSTRGLNIIPIETILLYLWTS